MSQSFVKQNSQGEQRCCKLYCGPDGYTVKYPIKHFFVTLCIAMCVGLVAAIFANKVCEYECVPLSFRITEGLANLALVGLIGLGIGLCIGVPIISISGMSCMLVGLVFSVFAFNEGRKMDIHVINSETGYDLGQYLGETIQGKIKNKEIQIVPITEKIANNLKQKGVID